MQPDFSTIVDRLSIAKPLVGVYDAPDPAPFEPLVVPRGRQCVFKAYPRWMEGATLHLTRDRHGCGYLMGEVDPRPRDEMIEFLCDEEGLRASRELMGLWLDALRHYEPRHDHVLVGPLNAGQYQYLRTVTFFVNPDQLAVLCLGATYYSRPDDPPPVLARFGAGCMQMLTLFDDLEVPQALIGTTDDAMRAELEPCTMGLTVTKPMFELLCRWAADPRGSLHSRWLDDLIRKRGGSLA